MKLQVPLALCALAGASLLVRPPTATGFSTLGGSLSLTQRDVRVFDNFTDAAANDDTTPHWSFPGYTGAERAIWRAVIEWSSETHAGGFGDPTQVGSLGSGGANFDPSWQGNTTSIGSSNGNIHSELAGSDGGVLAYCETPISDGWRIRYYQNWSWHDDTFPSPSGADLQGIGCHEYGHALGLGHSDVGGATMFPSASGTGASQRSIEADDIAGIQSIYGVKSGTKARITSIALAGAQLTINGANFSTTGNEVWFTKTGTGGDGTPIKLTNVSSTVSGTKITVNLPAGSGPGDVLVKKSGTTHSSLSNAWPLDPTGTPPAVPIVLGSSPSPVPAVAAGTNSIQLQGANLAGSVSVTVDGVPAAVSGSTSTTINITMPLVTKLGPVTVAVTSYLGTGTGTINVAAPLVPVIDVDPPLLLNGQPITVVIGSAPGDVAFLVVSPHLIPSDMPGVFSAAIGNGLTSLAHLSTTILPPKAWNQQVFTPTGVPPSTTLYFQPLVLTIANPVLPLVSGNVGSALVVL